jgi:hypothetical protein|tara:strand:+ start:2713 stop:3156 length:444 start_codon:yes stop_codon:yes gene_type:complete
MTQGEFEFIKGKVCKVCKEEKPESKFYFEKTGRWRFTTCKPCMSYINNQVIRLRKGFESLKPTNCECCGNSGNISLDHCHTTGSFRGFICQNCNSKLGRNGDSYESILEKDFDPMYENYLQLAGLRGGLNKRVQHGIVHRRGVKYEW